MKKFLPLILIVAATLVAGNACAQSTMAETDPAGATSTVNTNADTSYHTIQLAGQTFNYDVLTFILKGTKTSGTVLGHASLWGSNDNSRWFAVYGSKNLILADTTTAQAIGDESADLLWRVSKTNFRYYRIRVITYGTQVSSYDCTLLGRKVPN
jgi:hypothetical protein